LYFKHNLKHLKEKKTTLNIPFLTVCSRFSEMLIMQSRQSRHAICLSQDEFENGDLKNKVFAARALETL
jgi:hypothetical protein